MTGFTRLTVVGRTHRCELVVPSDEILGAVLPGMLDLLHEPAGPVTRPLRLVLPTGDQLDVGRTPADQRLRDGAVVRLVRAEEAPPPPEVADVTDVLGDDFGARADRWSDRARTGTGAVALGIVGATAAGLVMATDTQRLLAVAAVLALAVLAGRLAALAPAARTAAVALTGLALGLAATTALRLALTPGVTATGWVLPVATALGILGWACVGAGVGLGLGDRPALAGGLLGLAVVCVPLAASSAGPQRAAALGAAAAAVVACGLLPRYAAAAAGLTALDTAVVAGRRPPRGDVRQAVDRTYAALTWSVCGVAWTLAATSGVLLGSTDGWAAGLGLVVVTVTALRTRGFPVAAQQVALWSAVLAGLVVGAAGHAGPAPGGVTAGLAAVAVAVLVLTLARPPEHTRAVLRQVGDVVEVVAVVAMVPLLLGLFGVYADLLRAF